MTYNALHIMCGNGWKWHCYDSDPLCDSSNETQSYTMSFLGVYSTLVRAVVSAHSKHLGIDGHYGVLWLEVAKYECDPPYSESDLKDMIYALRLAEENLLKIGMPFTPDFNFHGNKANRRRRNEKLRRLYGLSELEEKDGQ